MEVGETVEVSEKTWQMHILRHYCGCPKEVENLLEGDRVWTRVRFKCGEVQKLNCSTLKIKE